MPIESGWFSGIEPLPIKVVATGAINVSAKATSSEQAFEAITPPPAIITGRSA